MLLLRIDIAFQIVNAIILAVAVAVKIFIGIVHDYGFPVLLHKCPFIFCALRIAGGVDVQCLLKRRGIFKSKAFLRKSRTIIIPHVARQAAMTFINQHKIVLLKAVNGNGFNLALLLELVHVDNDNFVE